jgi:hypothetical protein
MPKLQIGMTSLFFTSIINSERVYVFVTNLKDTSVERSHFYLELACIIFAALIADFWAP